MKILDWIVCDDVRMEDNGKKIMIGVYDQAINFKGLPSTRPEIIRLNLFSFIRVLKVSDDEVPDEVRVIFLTDKKSPNTVKLEVKPKDGEWKNLLTLVIKTTFEFKSSCRLSLKIELVRNDNIVKELEAPLDIAVNFDGDPPCQA